MTKALSLKNRLRRGRVYRRTDLAKWSKSVDRHIHELLEDGTLKKVSPGVYYYPKQTVFGAAPADEKALVEKFLQDDRFLVTSPNAYNSLGVGTTQLYNKRVVYNHKRHGEFKLGNKQFSFRVKPDFPTKPTVEFLLVDLVNNLNSLAEDASTVLGKVVDKVKSMDSRKLKRSLHKYGNARTKKLLSPVLDNLTAATNG